MRELLSPIEAKLGRYAAGALSGSLVLVVGFVFAVFGFATNSWQLLLSGLLVVLYLVQLYFLSTIGCHRAERRLRTWAFSTFAHFAIAAVAYIAVQSAAVFFLLIPEGISLLFHFGGIGHAIRSQHHVSQAIPFK